MAKAVVTVVALALAPLLGACVVEAGVAPPYNGVAVAGPPPQPVQELHTAAPGAQAVWVAGYWHWTGMQYTWIPGHWDRPPPGAIWRGPRYTVREGTYFYEPGGWWRPPR